MKKKVIVLMTALLVMMFGTLTAYASNSGGGGVSIDTGEKTNASAGYYGRVVGAGDTLHYSFIDHSDNSTLHNVDYNVTVTDGSVCAIAFESVDEYTNNSTILLYSSQEFSLSHYYDTYTYVGGEFYGSYTTGPYSNTSKFHSSSGLYYFTLTSGRPNYYSLEATFPIYNIKFSDSLDTSLEQLANGTFEEENADDFVGGTEVPDFSYDTADYIKDIGYLQNVTEKIAYVTEGDSVSANFTEVKYSFTWDSVTSTGFDVAASNVYVSFYNQVSGSVKNLVGGKTTEVVGDKVLIDRVKGSDLQLIAYQTDINSKCSDDLSKLDYTPLLQSISRLDAFWLRVEVYNPTFGTYSYGGWVKLSAKGDGSQTTTTTTWEPDTSGGNNDVQDSDGGYGDGERTPASVGGGSTIEDAENNMQPINTAVDYSSMDFVGILNTIYAGIGEFPAFLSEVYSFLPTAFTTVLIAGLSITVVCRVLGR